MTSSERSFPQLCETREKTPSVDPEAAANSCHCRSGNLSPVAGKPGLEPGPDLLGPHVLVDLQLTVVAGKLHKKGCDPFIGGMVLEDILAGPDEGRQVAPIVFLFSTAIVIAGLGPRGQGVCQGRVQDPEILRVARGASVAEIVEVVADRLVGDDESHRFAGMFPRQQRVDPSAFAMEGLGFDAHEGLAAQLGVGNLVCLFLPATEKAVHGWQDLRHGDMCQRYEISGNAHQLPPSALLTQARAQYKKEGP